MANDFSADSSVKALWRFEPGALLADSKGTNTLSASASSPTSDNADYQEGAGCALFTQANAQYFYINDASLNAGFPFKNGDTTKAGSFVFQYKPTTSISWRFLLSKSKYPPANAAFALVDQNGTLYVEWGQGSSNWNDTSTGIPLTPGHWYNIACICDPTGAVVVVVKDKTTGTVYYWRNNFGTAPYITNNAFCIGDRDGHNGNTINGRMDEVVVFNRVINYAEIMAIFAGTYNGPITSIGSNSFTGDARFKARWRFEPYDLLADSIGGNTLSGTAYAGMTGYTAEGAGCALLHENALLRTDANLDAGFPLKNGDAVKKITVCGWIIRDTGGIYDRCIWRKGTDLGLYYDNISGTTIGHGAFRAYLKYNGANYDLGFNLPLDPTHIAVAVDGVAKTAHIRYKAITAAAATNVDLSFAAVLNINTNDFQISGQTSSWLGWIDEIVVANNILSDADIDAIRNGTFIATVIRDLTSAAAAVSALASFNLLIARGLNSAAAGVSALSAGAGIIRKLTSFPHSSGSRSNEIQNFVAHNYPMGGRNFFVSITGTLEVAPTIPNTTAITVNGSWGSVTVVDDGGTLRDENGCGVGKLYDSGDWSLGFPFIAGPRIDFPPSVISVLASYEFSVDRAVSEISSFEVFNLLPLVSFALGLSALSSFALVTRGLLSNAYGVSNVQDLGLQVTRDLVTLAEAQSEAAAEVKVIRDLGSQAEAQSLLSNFYLGVGALMSMARGVSSVDALELKIIRDLASIVSAESLISLVPLEAQRALTSLAAGVSALSAFNLKILRRLVSLAESATELSEFEIDILCLLYSLAIGASQASEFNLLIDRHLFSHASARSILSALKLVMVQAPGDISGPLTLDPEQLRFNLERHIQPDGYDPKLLWRNIRRRTG